MLDIPYASLCFRFLQRQIYVRCPCSSTLAKQLSVILRRSSSKRSARDMPDGVELELAVVVVDGGPLAPPGGGGRLGGARESPRPLGWLRDLPSMLADMRSSRSQKVQFPNHEYPRAFKPPF
jgi:hypothetical protein